MTNNPIDPKPEETKQPVEPRYRIAWKNHKSPATRHDKTYTLAEAELLCEEFNQACTGVVHVPELVQTEPATASFKPEDVGHTIDGTELAAIFGGPEHAIHVIPYEGTDFRLSKAGLEAMADRMGYMLVSKAEIAAEDADRAAEEALDLSAEIVSVDEPVMVVRMNVSTKGKTINFPDYMNPDHPDFDPFHGE